MNMIHNSDSNEAVNTQSLQIYKDIDNIANYILSLINKQRNGIELSFHDKITLEDYNDYTINNQNNLNTWVSRLIPFWANRDGLAQEDVEEYINIESYISYRVEHDIIPDEMTLDNRDAVEEDSAFFTQLERLDRLTISGASMEEINRFRNCIIDEHGDRAIQMLGNTMYTTDLNPLPPNLEYERGT